MEDPASTPVPVRARVARVLGPALFLLIWLAPFEGLRPEAQRLGAVMALVVCFWIGEPIPVAVTALLGPVLALLLGAVPGADPRARVADAFAEFGDPILMLFIGGFFLAEAMTVHGLDRRLAMGILSRPAFGGSPERMLGGLAVCSCLLSMWMNNTSVTAIMIPIASGMLAVAAGGKVLEARAMLLLSFAATVGGMGTKVGTAPNLIGAAHLSKLAGVEIGFLSWMAFAVPLMLGMLGILVFVMTRGIPAGGGGVLEQAREEGRRLGPLSRGEAVTLAAFLLAVSLWIGSGLAPIWGWRFFSERLPEGAVAILAASLLFLIPASPGRPVLTWKEAARIDWGTLLLLGGGLSMGDLMLKTGLADAIGTSAAGLLPGAGPWALCALSAGLAILLSEVTSNTATATMLVPVVIGIAQKAGVSPVGPALAATLGCSFGFMLPVSTPPNALVYGTGRVPIATMIWLGAVLDAIGFAVIALGLGWLLPLAGLG